MSVWLLVDTATPLHSPLSMVLGCLLSTPPCCCRAPCKVAAYGTCVTTYFKKKTQHIESFELYSILLLMEESGPASYYELLLGYMVCSEYSRIRFSNKTFFDHGMISCSNICLICVRIIDVGVALINSVPGPATAVLQSQLIIGTHGIFYTARISDKKIYTVKVCVL